MKKVLGKRNILYVNRGGLKIYDWLLTLKSLINGKARINRDSGESLIQGGLEKISYEVKNQGEGGKIPKS